MSGNPRVRGPRWKAWRWMAGGPWILLSVFLPSWSLLRAPAELVASEGVFRNASIDDDDEKPEKGPKKKDADDAEEADGKGAGAAPPSRR